MKVPATDFNITLSQLSGHEGRGWQQPGIRGFFILWKGFDEHLEAGRAAGRGGFFAGGGTVSKTACHALQRANSR
jgi:hypothetical protein